MSPSMDPISLLLFLFFTSLLTQPHSVFSRQQNSDPFSRITVVGVVYCDPCSSNNFARHSYFLAGTEVHISCRFRASSPRTNEEVNISVNRTTDRRGVYKLEIPHVDGVDCIDGIAIASQCQASLIRSSNRACNVPLLKTSTNEISVKSKQDKLCIYSLSALSYKPSRRNTSLCGVQTQEEVMKVPQASSLNESKFFWPYFPPYWFPWPKSFPFPTLPPYPSMPFPPLPYTNPNPPSSPFPFPPFLRTSPPPLPFPFPQAPPLFRSQPPPAFNLSDPRTWAPNLPSFSPPPALPQFDWRNPNTWTPYFPSFPPNKLQNPSP